MDIGYLFRRFRCCDGHDVQRWNIFLIDRTRSMLVELPNRQIAMAAGNVVLDASTWGEIPEANRRAVEAAADGLGLSIEDLRTRLRAAAQEEPPASCENTFRNFNGRKMRILGDGGGSDTITGNLSGKSLGKFSSGGPPDLQKGKAKRAISRNFGRKLKL